MTQRLQHALCALMAAWLILAPASAWGQDASREATPEELAAARALFAEAKELEKEGEWRAALERIETVAKVKMTPQVRFHLGLCYENLGRLVDAVNSYELAEQEAKASGGKADDVEQNAPKRAEAVRARVAHLTLEVSGTIYTSKVYIDGREVSPALFGQDIPVDPGDRVVEVKRGSVVSQREELSFAEAESQELAITINDPKPPPAPSPDPDVPDPDPRPDKPPVVDDPPQWIAYVVAGAGVVGLVTSAILWSVRQSELDKIAVACEDPENFKGCDDRFEPTADSAEKIDVTAKVLLGLGSAALATGVVLWFVLLPEDAPPTTGKTKARIGVVPGLGGVSVVGTF